MLSKVYSNDFFMEALKGNIDNITAVRLIGRNPDNDAATEDVWIGADVNFGDGYALIRTLRATAALVKVSSSADHATDRGRSVTITGVDGNYDIVSETIHLNSTNSQTAVSSVNTYLRVNSAVLDGACTGTVFVGTSAVTAGVPDEKTKVDAVIAIAKLFAEQSLYTVPRNKKGYVYSVDITTTTTGTALSATLTVTTSGAVATNYTLGNFASPGTITKLFPVPIEVDAESDVVLTVTSDTANIVVNSTVNMILEDVEVSVSTVDLVNFGTWRAYMSGKTITSAALYLIGLDSVPTVIPTSAAWNVVAGPITGQTADNDQLNPAHDTTISFDIAHFAGGTYDILANATGYKSVLAVWKVVDSTAATKYVISPINTATDYIRLRSATMKFLAL